MVLGTASPGGDEDQRLLCRPTRTALSPALLLAGMDKMGIQPPPRKKWTQDGFSALPPMRKACTSLGNFLTVLDSHALVYDAFPLAPGGNKK